METMKLIMDDQLKKLLSSKIGQFNVKNDSDQFSLLNFQSISINCFWVGLGNIGIKLVRRLILTFSSNLNLIG